MTHEIVLAVDTPEAESFAQWLRDQGHDAAVGRTTGNYVDGMSDEESSEILQSLWTGFCNRY